MWRYCSLSDMRRLLKANYFFKSGCYCGDADHSSTGPQMRHIVEICDASGVVYKTLPGLGELINGKVSVKAPRDVDFQDLLGREPV